MNSRPKIRDIDIDNRIDRYDPRSPRRPIPVYVRVRAASLPVGWSIFQWLPVVLLAVLCVGALVLAATFQAAPVR